MKQIYVLLIALLIGGLWAQPVSAATFIAGNGQKEDGSGTSIATTIGGAGVSAGNFVMCVVKFEGASLDAGNISATDGTATLTEDPDGVVAHVGAGDLFSLAMWLPASVGGGDTFTVTLSAARAWKQLACGAFSYSGTIALDDSTSAGVDIDTMTSTYTGPAATIAGSELIAVACWGNYATATPTARTINGTAADGNFGNSDGTQCWYRLLSSGYTAGVTTLVFSSVPATEATMHHLGFEVTAGGGGSACRDMSLLGVSRCAE